MVEKAKDQKVEVSADENICGIVMPIAGTEPPYTDAHWRDVKDIIERAIALSGLRAQPVWEQNSTDVIHSRIVGNLYQNAVVVCDVSALRPNVMLELGMRLSTRLPTIIISDMEVRPPFDTALIEHMAYPVNLEYLATDAFIGKLSEKIKSVHQGAIDKTYRSFVEKFTFETVKPNEVEVPATEFILERLDQLAGAISRLDRRERNAFAHSTVPNALRGYGNDPYPSADTYSLFDVRISGPKASVQPTVDRLAAIGFEVSRFLTKSNDSTVLRLRGPQIALRALTDWFRGALPADLRLESIEIVPA